MNWIGRDAVISILVHLFGLLIQVKPDETIIMHPQRLLHHHSQ